MLARARGVLFRVPLDRASLVGVRCPDPETRERLERVMRVFLRGHNMAAAARFPEEVVEALDGAFDDHHIGFAFEGAGMHLAMMDLLFKRRSSRLRRFIEGPGLSHDYICCVGAGFAIARVPFGERRLAGYQRRLDPLIAWCVSEGLGFHRGFFGADRELPVRARVPRGLPEAERRLFDSGIGRSLWWTEGGSPAAVRLAIETLPEPRRSDMWFGLGIACAYACCVGTGVIDELAETAGDYRQDFLCGIPFAARMRQRGENPSAETELVCRRLLGMSADDAADWIVGEVANIGHRDLSEEAKRRYSYGLVRGRLKVSLESRRSASGRLVSSLAEG